MDGKIIGTTRVLRTGLQDDRTTDNRIEPLKARTHTKRGEKRRAAPGEPGLALSSQNLFTSELARDCEITSLIRYADGPALAAEPPMADGGGRRTEGKSGELVHKSSGGEGSGSMSPIGQSSCAGAKPELPVCEQGRVDKAESGNSHATSHSLPATAPEALFFFL